MSSLKVSQRARASQLWTKFGHPTEEFINLNEKWFANCRESTSKDEGNDDRIFEIQTWIQNRLPQRPSEISHPLIIDMNIHTY